MKKNIARVLCIVMLLGLWSCKKHKDVTPEPSHLVTLGMYEAASGTNKRIYLPITKIGTQAVTYYTIFDTGSVGLTMDATDIIPASMITTNGITITGDSVVVNGITVTSRTAIMSYGDQTGTTREYGNVAYATFTLGDANGNVGTRRIPFFLYYKIVDSKGVQAKAHSADVFGVGPGTSYASTLIASPLSYFDLSNTGLTNGFRLALLNNSSFSSSGTYVGGLLSIGLTPEDLTTSGFIMHPFSINSAGYNAEIPATITYGSQTVTGAQVMFDTGTPSITVIEDKTATGIGPLAANTKVTITTNKGFVYSYTTASTANLTSIQNPNLSGDYRTIFSLDFFINNEYLTDYTNHQTGLKNN